MFRVYALQNPAEKFYGIDQCHRQVVGDSINDKIRIQRRRQNLARFTKMRILRQKTGRTENGDSMPGRKTAGDLQQSPQLTGMH